MLRKLARSPQSCSAGAQADDIRKRAPRAVFKSFSQFSEQGLLCALAWASAFYASFGIAREEQRSASAARLERTDTARGLPSFFLYFFLRFLMTFRFAAALASRKFGRASQGWGRAEQGPRKTWSLGLAIARGRLALARGARVAELERT